MQSKLVIRTEGLSKTYNGTTALKSLDLKVPEHSIFGFLGPNGAGKTTTIKLLLARAHGFHLLYWLTHTLMLGTFFKGRGAVIGIPVLLLGFQDLIAELGRIYIPGLELWLPKRIEEIATQTTLGRPISSMVPLFAISLQIVIFTILAFWRFKREEF